MAYITADEIADFLQLDSTPTLLTALLPQAEHAVIEFLGYDYRLKEHTEYYPLTQRTADRANLVDVTGNRAIFYGPELANNFLELRHRPVRTEHGPHGSDNPVVYEDYNARYGSVSGSFGAATQLTYGDDFYLDIDNGEATSLSATLIRVGANWPSEMGSVKIVYSAGYHEDELADLDSNDNQINAPDIKLAVMITASEFYKTSVVSGATSAAGLVAGPIASESLGDYSYSVASNAAAVAGWVGSSIPRQAQNLLQRHKSYFGVFVK